MRQKWRMTAGILMLVALTGCEAVKQSPVSGLTEGPEGWVVEVHAKSDIEEAVKNANEAVNSANEAIAGVKQAMESTEVAAVPQPTQVPEPTATPKPVSYEFTTGDKEYFSDALFIGDSRTVGIQLYGNLDNADYFATPGLSLYSIPRTTLTVGEYEDVTLEALLEKKDYGKIYLMLGINELGYNYEKTITKYKELVTQLRTKEPQAILFVCANLHVTRTRDENDETHNNESINRINGEISTLADQREIFYLDVNSLFDDEAGNLNETYASDDSHVIGEYYEVWCDWLKEHTIVK